MIQLQLGFNVAAATPDKLEIITLDQLAEAISKPLYDLAVKTSHLRRVGGIDKKAYQALKKDLPYVTCGIFNPPVRRTENFAGIQCFMLDFDHLSEKETDPETLKKRLKEDDRIALMFTSPGGDGLKVLFVLKEPFKDHGKYSLFYKVFIADFARSINMQQVIDKKTSDATRATFLCHDPDCWYNPIYTEIEPAHWINFESSLEIDEALELGRQQEMELKEVLKEQASDAEPEDELPDETLDQIKLKLNPKYKPKPKKKSYYVPDKVILLEAEIRERCQEVGIEVTESQEIQYGKQLSFKAGEHVAELNIFFGKRGFSVVKSTKTICSDELNTIACQLVMELIED